MADADRTLRVAHADDDLHYDGPASPWFGFSQVDPDAWRAERARVYTEQNRLYAGPGARDRRSVRSPIRAAYRRLGPDLSFMIDYAQYDRRPAGFLPLLDWLGEELPPATLEAVGGHRLTNLHEPRPSWPARFFRFAAPSVRSWIRARRRGR